MSDFSPEVDNFFSFSSISPPLFSSAGRQKEVRATEVLFGYLFMVFPFNIHAFFQDYLGTEENVPPWNAAVAKNQVSAPMGLVDEGKREREMDR